MNQLIGEIKPFAGNYAPKYWAKCDGQELQRKDHPALFAVIGIIYGGDGINTFKLPDLRGRTLIHAGNAQGLTDRTIGQSSGNETNTLSTNELPTHSHTATTAVEVTIGASSENGNIKQPSDGNVIATPGYGQSRSYVQHFGFNSETPDVELAGGAATATTTIGEEGNQQPISNMQPFVAINYIIALAGVYPEAE